MWAYTMTVIPTIGYGSHTTDRRPSKPMLSRSKNARVFSAYAYYALEWLAV